jgi:hypothetical protein
MSVVEETKGEAGRKGSGGGDRDAKRAGGKKFSRDRAQSFNEAAGLAWAAMQEGCLLARQFR